MNDIVLSVRNVVREFGGRDGTFWPTPDLVSVPNGDSHESG